MKYVISVSKAYTHRGNHRHKTKKYWYVYYYNEEGSLRTRKVNSLQALYYKSKLYKRRRFYCLECGNRFIGLIKKETDNPDCPYCSE